MKIIPSFLDKNQFSRPGTQMSQVKAIIIHYVGNPGTSAVANRGYFNSLKNQKPNDGKRDTYASSHYIIGLEGEVLILIPEDEIAYHAGGSKYTQKAQYLFWDAERKSVYPHDKCIGIEVCHPTIGGRFTSETYESLLGLVEDLCRRHQLGVNDVLRHFDVTGKICPRMMVEDEDYWKEFQEDLFKRLS